MDCSKILNHGSFKYIVANFFHLSSIVGENDSNLNLKLSYRPETSSFFICPSDCAEQPFSSVYNTLDA